MVLTESNYQTLKKSNAAPEFSLKGIDDKTHSLSDFKGKLVLVIFMCNHCPYVLEKLEELNKIADKFKNNLVVIGINANDSQHEPMDSFENMKKLAQSEQVRFRYLFDETQQTAKKYGAVCTPDPFLFDAEHKLVFHGHVDQLEEATDELLTTKKVTLEEKPSLGCSIKWK